MFLLEKVFLVKLVQKKLPYVANFFFGFVSRLKTKVSVWNDHREI